MICNLNTQTQVYLVREISYGSNCSFVPACWFFKFKTYEIAYADSEISTISEFSKDPTSSIIKLICWERLVIMSVKQSLCKHLNLMSVYIGKIGALENNSKFYTSLLLKLK